MWNEILTAVGITLLLWILYRGIKNNPLSFSKENINKSFRSLGWLALLLMALVGLSIIALR